MFDLKGQSSMEFLAILAIGLTMISIFAGLFFTYSNEAKISMDKDHIERIGSNLMTNIEKIYFLGNGNKYLYRTNFPKTLINFTIEHRNNSGTCFDYLNITYMSENDEVSDTFTPKESYIRFNCSYCNHTTNNHGNYTSYYGYYNDNYSEIISWGPKEIEINSLGDYVSIDFRR